MTFSAEWTELVFSGTNTAFKPRELNEAAGRELIPELTLI